MKKQMLGPDDIEKRFVELYALGHEGEIAESPFYLHALGFDGGPGTLGAELISSFNKMAKKDGALSRYSLDRVAYKSLSLYLICCFK